MSNVSHGPEDLPTMGNLWAHWEKSLLPSSASKLQHALEASALRASQLPIVGIRQVWNPNTCPENLLPWLAYAFSVDNWDSNWTEAQKRQIIKDSLYIHQHKGTIGAIKKALQSLGYKISVVEWFQNGGDPYTFQIKVGVPDTGITNDLYDSVDRIVRDTKNVRSALSSMIVSGDVYGKFFVASSLSDGVNTEVKTYNPGTVSVSNSIFFASGMILGETVTVGARSELWRYNGTVKYDGTAIYF